LVDGMRDMGEGSGAETAGGSTVPVFISYASQDAAIADKVCAALEAAGMLCWIAPRDVHAGRSYAAAIVEAINSCRMLLLALSQSAIDSPHVLREVERASSKRRPVLSVRIDDAKLPPDLEYFLSANQWLDACGRPIEQILPAVVGSVRDHDSGQTRRDALGLNGSARSASGPASSAAPGKSAFRWGMRALTAAVVIAAGYFAIDRLILSKRFATVESTPTVSADSTVPGALPEKSVAVLPLVNLSSDNKDSYLGDGISGEILSALSKLPDLKVIGRASSFQFRDRDVDAVKVGRALNVRSMLTGTVQRAGDKLRISVELIDTTSGVQLWSQHFDRSFGNLFALEDDISNAVSAALAIKLGMAAGQPLVQTATANPDAQDLYLRAKELSYRSDEPSLNQAVNLFNRAIAADPNYAAAWAGLTNTYLSLADAYRAPIDLLPVMKAAAEKTVALDPKLAEGHAYLSYILISYQRDFATAGRELDQAVALNPGSADVQLFLGLDRILTREYAASQSALRMAEKLDPLNAFVPFAEIWAATALGDSATALQKAQRTLEIDPAFSYFTDPLVLAYGSFGRWQDCVARSTAVRPAAGTEPDYKAAVCYAHLGNYAQARRILAQLEAAARTRYVDHANIAEIYVALGEKDTAFQALEQAYNDRSQPLALVWAFPEFRPLHDDARYKALMEKVYAGLKPRAAP
jgi:TolB-like protein/Tfp pilus assembly protein PilF